MRNVMTLLIAASALLAGTMTIPVGYAPTDFLLSQDGEFTKVYLKGGELAGEPGMPALPSVAINVMLPPGQRAIRARLIDTNYATLAAPVLAYPFQKPTPFGVAAQFTQIDSARYFGESGSSVSPLTLTGTASMRGYQIAGLTLIPTKYDPQSRKLFYLTSGTIEVEYAPMRSYSLMPRRATVSAQHIFNKLAEQTVINPDAMQEYQTLPIEDGYDGVLIVPAMYISEWEPLRYLHSAMGHRDTVITVEDAVASFPGVDDAERLRNAIKQLYEDEGIWYAVLCGDVELVPDRWLYAMDSEAGFYTDENQIQSDYYYAALDGSFNADGDTVWGEVEDSVDIYQDILVGRLSTWSEAQITGIVDKLTDYTLYPTAGYLDRTLFLAMVLWDDPMTDAAIGKDIIRDACIPDYVDLTRQYQTLGNENIDNFFLAMESGQGIINHAGHANTSVIGLGGEYLNSGGVDTLDNDGLYGIMYSIGCWAAAFDRDDCIAEHFVVRNSHGGTVAFVGNNRYGWGSPGNPGYGYSDFYDLRFFESLYGAPSQPLGVHLAAAKNRYAPYCHWANVWRWHLYEINILGDPSLPARIREPRAIVVSGIPDSVSAGELSFTICLSDTSGESINGTVAALVSDELMESADVGAGGCIDLSLSLSSGDELVIVSSAAGYRPVIDTIAVIVSSMPFLTARVDRISDTLGFIDGEANPGDSVVIMLWIKNISLSEATGVSWTPTPVLDYADLPTSISSFDSVSSWVKVAVPLDGDAVSFSSELIWDDGAFDASLSVPINRFQLVIDSLWIASSDTVLNNGSSFEICLSVRNDGDGTSPNGMFSASAFSSGVSISGGTVAIPAISPDSSAYLSLSGEVLLDAANPGVELVSISLETGSITIVDTIAIPVGNLFFSDDAEGGMVNFTTGGVPDIWDITDREANSVSHSFWCGDETGGTYLNNSDAYIESIPIMVGAEPSLHFYLSYDVTTYGSDGIYIEVIDGVDTLQLDYIGSGGALPFTFSMGWSEFTYPLTFCAPGDSIRLRFVFSSDDADVAEGFFIDDIVVDGGFLPVVPMRALECLSQPTGIGISAYPNPFNSSVVISVEQTSLSDIPTDIAIYDIKGNVVATLSPLTRGTETDRRQGVVIWTPDKTVPSGIYLVRATTQDGQSATKRIVYLK